MKALKILLLLLLTLSFTQCKTIRLVENPPFKITGATYNNWVGGQPGVSGIKVIIRVDAGKEITFDKMYFYKKTTSVELNTTNNKEYLIGHFNTSTRNQLNRTIENATAKKEKSKTIKDTFPFELKENEAVISYKKGAKTFYYKVSNIKKTKTDFYP